MDATYFLKEEGESYVLYLLPEYDDVDYSEIIITAGFHGDDRVKSWSNNPAGKFPKEFEFVEDVDAYRMGDVSKSEFPDFDILKILLRYGETEFRFWDVSLGDVEIREG